MDRPINVNEVQFDDFQWNLFRKATANLYANMNKLSDRERAFIQEIKVAQQLANQRQFGLTARQFSWLRSMSQEIEDGKR